MNEETNQIRRRLSEAENENGRYTIMKKNCFCFQESDCLEFKRESLVSDFIEIE